MQRPYIFQFPRQVLAESLTQINVGSPAFDASYFTEDGSSKKDDPNRPYIPEWIVRRRASAIGAEYISVEGDGNCLARAFSVVLYGDQQAHRTVRALYTGYVLGDSTLHAFVPDFAPLSYIRRHLDPTPDGDWGGNVELEAVARALRLTVFLITDDKNNCVVEVCRHGNTACCLTYIRTNHYGVVGFRTSPREASDASVEGCVEKEKHEEWDEKVKHEEWDETF